jgi:hypothetical protein
MESRAKHAFSEGKLYCRNNPNTINAFIAYIGGTVNSEDWDFSSGRYSSCGLN